MCNFAIQIKNVVMAKVCQITGKKAQNGNNVSHANNKTKRKFHVNLFKKRFFSAEKEDWVTIKVSAHGLRIINKLGFDEAFKKAKYSGFLN